MEYLSELDYKVAASNGISYMTAYHRVYTHKWPIEKAITKPTSKKGRPHSEVYLRWKDECDKLGISSKTFLNRIKRGKTEEEAATTPLEHQRTRKETEPFKELPKAQYIRLKKADKTDQEIADLIKWSISTLTIWKRENNLIMQVRKLPGRIPESFTDDHYRDMKKAKWKDTEIADLMVVTESGFRQWKRKRGLIGIKLDKKDYHEYYIPSSFTVEDYIKLKDDYMPDIDIAEGVLFVSMSALQTWKKKNNLIGKYNVQPEVSRKIKSIDRVVAAHKRGVSQRKIAERYDVTGSTIHRILEKYKEETNDHYTVVRPIRQFSRR
jgi:hypothetical protein